MAARMEAGRLRHEAVAVSGHYGGFPAVWRRISPLGKTNWAISSLDRGNFASTFSRGSASQAVRTASNGFARVWDGGVPHFTLAANDNLHEPPGR